MLRYVAKGIVRKVEAPAVEKPKPFKRDAVKQSETVKQLPSVKQPSIFVGVRLPADMIARIDAMDGTRSEVIRRLIEASL